MPNYSMKCPSCRTILMCLFLMLAIVHPSEGYPRKLAIAKKNFMTRERDYLKSKPISEDLKSFIRRFKRRTGYLGRSKRQEDLKQHMFVVNNGNIEPLENMSDVTSDGQELDSAEFGNFTVIPLIIPITMKTYTNSTMCENCEGYSDAATESRFKYDKADSDVHSVEINTSTRIESAKTEVLPQLSNSTTTVKMMGGENTVVPSTTEVEPNKPTSKVSIDKTTTEIIIDDALSTMKKDNVKFLDRVLTDVKELISYEKEGKAAGSGEGAMCTVIGDWDSEVGGMQLRIEGGNDSTKQPSVGLARQEPEAETGFLRTGAWNIAAQMPFKHSSLILLTAVSEKTVATFIGDCRICEGAETITGNWMLGRRSSNCNDRQATHQFFSDVMRKNNVRKLHKAHLEEMNTRALVTTTEG